eukprot:727391-Rhodomonas_salina.1
MLASGYWIDAASALRMKDNGTGLCECALHGADTARGPLRCTALTACGAASHHCPRPCQPRHHRS